MMRRLVPMLVLPLLAGAVHADVPAELLASPPPAVPPAATPGGAKADADLVAELISVFVPADQARDFQKLSPANRTKIITEVWDKLAPHERACIRYAADRFSEAGSALTPRTVALLALGPPESIHDQKDRAWSGELSPNLPSAVGLIPVLKPGTKAPPPAAAADGTMLQGPLATQVWVYPGATVNDKRLLWFVDDGSDGTWRFARQDLSVPLADLVLAGVAQEMPPELFPAVGAGAVFEALPALTQDALPITVTMDTFRASAGKTVARIMAVIDPQDVDLELEGDPAAFAAAADLWLRVEKDGQGEHQAKVALVSLAASEPWLATFDVALAPGQHQATLLAADKTGKGGKKTLTLEVPSYASGLAMSSVVLAKAEPIGGDVGLPKAPVQADGSLAPFQIGTFTVRPMVPPVFKRGDTIAIVAQVYGDSKASLELDLFREGSYQNSTDPVQIDRFPHTGIELITVVPEFSDGAYEFRLTAKSGGTEIVRKVSFRVKG